MRKQGRSFVFPEGANLHGGESVHVYTNVVDVDTGGLGFAGPETLWDNLGGDAAVLFDAAERRLAGHRLRRQRAGG